MLNALNYTYVLPYIYIYLGSDHKDLIHLSSKFNSISSLIKTMVVVSILIQHTLPKPKGELEKWLLVKIDYLIDIEKEEGRFPRD